MLISLKAMDLQEQDDEEDDTLEALDEDLEAEDGQG